jgi:hypothetical protein
MTKVKSQELAERGKKGAAAVDRDPLTHRFVSRKPAVPPAAEPAAGLGTPPVGGNTPPPAPPPDFSEARRVWGRLRRRADR